MKNKINNNQGFTLIELLLVMVIIGILAAVVFTNIDVSRLTGRGGDTKRLADLRSMQDGILRETAQGYIAIPTTGTFSSVITNANFVDGTTGWIRFSTSPATPTGYKFSNLAVLPVDPKNNTTVTYNVVSGTTTTTATAISRYVICYSTAGFEIDTLLEQDSAKMNNDGGDDATAYEVGTDLKACAANSVTKYSN